MKKEWQKPNLEVLDVKMTMFELFGNGNGNNGNGNGNGGPKGS